MSFSSFAQFRLSTSTIAFAVPPEGEQSSVFHISIDATTPCEPGEGTCDYYSPIGRENMLYEIVRSKHCDTEGGDGNCITYAPDLCRYLELSPWREEDTEWGFPFDPLDLELWGQAGGALSAAYDMYDNWNLRIVAPCFGGECSAGYDANIMGEPLPEALRGETFRCDLAVAVRYPPVLMYDHLRAKPAYADVAPNTITISAQFKEVETVPSCTENCNSNVLFLPGLEASRLYRPDYSGGTDQLWEPNIDDDVEALFLDENGKSIKSDIYTKDVLDEVNVTPLAQANIYKTFLATMNRMRDEEHLFNEWTALPYDWRLSLEDILLSGTKTVDGYSYTEATSSPYILEELRRLASTSRTGKVTIIAHSNGGLLAKALMVKLGDVETSALIDTVILVASPQVGTPEAIGALLNGDKQGHFPVVTTETARALAQNMPGAYGLLPSTQYFSSVFDPVVEFEENVLPTAMFRSTYGNEIASSGAFQAFLRGMEGRVMPARDNVSYPNIANETLLTQANQLHETIDAWTPPQGVIVHQIAGWGIDTVRGIKYVKGGRFHCLGVNPCLDYDPLITEDGDGTVVAPSALVMSTSTENVQRWWVDLAEYDTLISSEINHADILEISELHDLLRSIISRSSPIILPQYVSQTKPDTLKDEKRLRFTLHSPLSLDLYDSDGRYTGISTSTGEMVTEIPGTYYHEFGHVKYVSAPASSSPRVVLRGYEDGGFTLKIEEVFANHVVASTTFADIPSSTTTVVDLDISTGMIREIGPLLIDRDGDGDNEVAIPAELDGVRYPDTTPPEARITFSTSTSRLHVEGVDESDTTVVSFATSSIIEDAFGNTTELFYTRKDEKRGRATMKISGVGYNGVVTVVPTTTVQYKWKKDRRGSYEMFATYVKTVSGTLEAHYRPKKNVTLIMLKPTELDDRDEDEGCEKRNVRTTLPGLVVPFLQTKAGDVFYDF